MERIFDISYFPMKPLCQMSDVMQEATKRKGNLLKSPPISSLSYGRACTRNGRDTVMAQSAAISPSYEESEDLGPTPTESPPEQLGSTPDPMGEALGSKNTSSHDQAAESFRSRKRCQRS